MKLLRYILFPVVPAYYAVTWTRNRLYDLDVYKSKSYDVPIICVGNLSVGGTGKTPMIEYLIRLLKDEYSLATLSRGYKRSTVGFYLGDSQASAKTLGDEPFQFYNKFKNDVLVAVDGNRQRGIENLLELENKPEAILLDDAFQHRKVSAGLNILLTTYSNLYTNDWVLPSGDLREPKQGAKRAQIIVVTKCPGLSVSDKKSIIKKLKPKAYQSVFFSIIQYANEVVSSQGALSLDALNSFTLVTGIANAKPLVKYLKGRELSFNHLNYKDHYEFSEKDIETFKTKELIVTTEKDYMRLLQYKELQTKLYYLPIEVVIDNTESFNEKIKQFVSTMH